MQSVNIERSGEGVQTIVFLHGVFMDRTLWRHVTQQVSGADILTIDMPGHGVASHLESGLSLDDHVSAIADALDGEGVRQALLVGHSWGGMVALRLAHVRPDLVHGVVFANTPLRRVDGTARLGFQAQRILLALGMPPRLYGRFAARALIGKAHRSRQPDDADDLRNRLAEMGRRSIDETIRSVLLEPRDATHLLGTLELPWIFVAGARDYVLSNGTADLISAAGPLRIAAGAHTTPLEDPATLVEAIAEVRAL